MPSKKSRRKAKASGAARTDADRPPPPPSDDVDDVVSRLQTVSVAEADDDVGALDEASLAAAMGELAIARGCQVLLVGLRTASLNNSIGLVVSGPTGPDRRYGVDLDGGRPKAIKQANLVLVDDGVGRPSAWDAIRHSPPLAREETCDMLCKNLVPIVLPELAQTDSIVLPFDSDIARGYNGRPWPRQATRRLVWVQLDAACHHCLLEWLGKDQGWRVFQSNVECYTAGAWASPLGNELHKTNQLGEQGFIDGGDAHARFGAGRLLDDKGISEYWRRLLHLRRVSDDVVKDVLLPQCPVDLSSLTPASERAPVLRAWNEKAIAVQNWAVGWLDKAEGGLGCTGVPTPDTFDIYVGRDRLFRVPNDSYKALCLAFIEVTGDRILNFIFLRLLNYIGYARRPFPCPDYETSGATTRMGFAVQAICGGDTPMEPRML